MLLCGIINELRAKEAATVLRGFNYLLIDQQPLLYLACTEKSYDHAGGALFEDTNAIAWVALSSTFASNLQDPDLNRTYPVIDALDDCVASCLTS